MPFQLPDVPRILLFGHACALTPEDRDRVFLWARILRRVNPDTEILFVDSASDRDMRDLRDASVHLRQPHALDRDLPLREFQLALDYAIAKDFEWLVYVDVSLILARPVTPFVEKLCRIGALAASVPDSHGDYFNSALLAVSCRYAAATNLGARITAWTVPALHTALEDELLLLPLRPNQDFAIESDVLPGLFRANGIEL